MAPARTRLPLPSLGSEQLTAVFRTRLGGGIPVVLWAERGDRVLLHVSRTTAEIHAHGVVVTVPLESTESGVTPVTVSLALPSGDEAPDRVAATEEDPEGDPRVVGRWGASLQDAVFGALLALLEDESKAAGGEPLGFHVREGVLALIAHAPWGGT